MPDLSHASVVVPSFGSAVGPIRSDLSMPSIFPAQIVVPYRATVVPRGCRKPQARWFYAEETIPIRVVDAPVAFRIRFPRSTNFGANELDVLYFEGGYFWPFHYDAESSCLRGTVGNALAALRGGRKDLLGLLPSGVGCPDRRISDVSPREILSSEFEAYVARACRKVSDNILVSGHRMYVRGGEPVWAARLEGSEPKVGIASTGARRAGSDQGLKAEVGHFLHEDVQHAFAYGRL